MTPPGHSHKLALQDTALVLVDVQEKLTSVMHEQDALVNGLVKLVQGLLCLDVPICWFEQNPARLGPTIPALRNLLASTHHPISKMHFSCCGEQNGRNAILATGRTQILIAGIESHVCVYQTADHLLAESRQVQIVVDATSSRNPCDRDIALQRLQMRALTQHQALPALTTVETVLFELMQTAENQAFRTIRQIIR